MIGDNWVIDSTEVVYYWEHPYYPKYLVPLADIRTDAVADEHLSACLLYTSPSPRDS